MLSAHITIKSKHTYISKQRNMTEKKNNNINTMKALKPTQDFHNCWALP